MPPKRLKKRHGPPTHGVRYFAINTGLQPLSVMQSELMDMLEVLQGKREPPVQVGTLTLLEVASSYHARALEITMLIQQKEREGKVARASPYAKFRTGELRTFTEIAKAAATLGSRRLSSEELEFNQARFGRDL